MHVSAWGLIRRNGNTEMVSIGAKLGLRGLFMKTPLSSVNTMYEKDRVIFMPHKGTFSDNDQKPPVSVILWSLQGKNLAKVAKMPIDSENSPN